MRQDDHRRPRLRALRFDAGSVVQMAIAAAITFFVGWLVGRLG